MAVQLTEDLNAIVSDSAEVNSGSPTQVDLKKSVTLSSDGTAALTVPEGVTLDITATFITITLGNNAVLTVNGEVKIHGYTSDTSTINGGLHISAETNTGALINGKGTIRLAATEDSEMGHLLMVLKDNKLTITDVQLVGGSNNRAAIYVIGELLMNGSASVSGNFGDEGGGVYVTRYVIIGVDGFKVIIEEDKQGVFTMSDDASVTGNKAYYGGGVYVDGGIFTMNDNASVSGNTGSCGAGVQVDVHGTSDFTEKSFNGTFTMNDNASVSNNSGDGVRIDAHYATGSLLKKVGGGTFIMNDNSRVSGNSERGVGVFIGDFTMNNNTSVSGNGGRGVYVTYSGGGGDAYNKDISSTFIMSGSTVYGIAAAGAGENANGYSSLSIGYSSSSETFAKYGKEGSYTSFGSDIAKGGLVNGETSRTLSVDHETGALTVTPSN